MRRKDPENPLAETAIADEKAFDPVTVGKLIFPDPRTGDEYGPLAIGGDFRPEMLLAAYANGIFPWPNEDYPYSWFSPDPRMVLRPTEFRVSRSFRKVLRQRVFRTTYDEAFEAVIEGCAAAPRGDDVGTWITEELRQGFIQLHHWGFAHSVEVWTDDELVGGLYGLALGGIFCGESMFHTRSNASKVALWALCQKVAELSFELIDCQVHTDHLESLGAEEWPRDDFLDTLEEVLRQPTVRGSWREED